MDFSSFIDKCREFEDPHVDISRTERMFAEKGDGEFEGVYISSSKLSSIKRFYESTNNINKRKIAGLINNNVNNFDKVHRIVIDYEKAQIHRESNNYGR